MSGQELIEQIVAFLREKKIPPTRAAIMSVLRQITDIKAKMVQL